MKIKRLRPRMPMPPALQCSAPIKRLQHWGTGNDDGYWQRRVEKCREKGWVATRCTHHASYMFDGAPYCTAHAGKMALYMIEKVSDAPDAPHSEDRE